MGGSIRREWERCLSSGDGVGEEALVERGCVCESATNCDGRVWNGVMSWRRAQDGGPVVN